MVLATLIANGGSATMAAFYAAVNAAMAPHSLSSNGRAGLRCYVNRNCLKNGLVEADRKARHAALWQITAKGRARVAPKLSLVPPLPPTPDPEHTEPNETAVWLGEHMAPSRGESESDLYRMMRAALYKRLPLSANTGQVEDHIQNYMVRAIHRNALRKLLATGRKVPYSKVIAYCVNSGRSDARNMGKEPICREMFGARTEKERREMAQHGDDVAFGEPTSSVLDTDGNLVPQEDSLPSTNETGSDFDRVWQQIENVVHDHKPRAWERYAGILAMRARGFTTRDIAAVENVSRNRAASMLAEARRCVRDGLAQGHLEGFVSL